MSYDVSGRNKQNLITYSNGAERNISHNFHLLLLLIITTITNNYNKLISVGNISWEEAW